MVYLGADHGGFELKEEIKHWLGEWGIDYEDLGSHTLNMEDDYPDPAFAVAKKVAEDLILHRGILLCRSGGGMAIAANKVKGVRAVVISDARSAIHSREHDDANIMAVAADWVSSKEAKTAIHAFLKTPFSTEEKRIRRRNKIEEFEQRV